MSNNLSFKEVFNGDVYDLRNAYALAGYSKEEWDALEDDAARLEALLEKADWYCRNEPYFDNDFYMRDYIFDMWIANEWENVKNTKVGSEERKAFINSLKEYEKAG